MKQKVFQIFVYLFWGSSQAQHHKHVCMAMAPGYLDTHHATVDILSRSLYCTVHNQFNRF